MQSISAQIVGWLVVIVLVGLSLLLLVWDTPLNYLSGLIGENLVLSSFVFVAVLVFATVLAPLTVMPIIPATAVMIGPFLTGFLSMVGWTLGSVLAFLIARYAGKPILKRFVSLETIQKYEHLIPENAQFLTIVVLRMMIPVDVLSYALGLTLSISLWNYTLATLIGVAWFSFAFAYLGDAFYSGDIVVFTLIGGSSLVILLVGWYLVLHKKKDQ